MTTKHNKKRNTGFVYEALIRELTRAAVEGKNKRKANIAKLIKESFSTGTVLGRELDCYRALNETQGLSETSAEKLIGATKNAYSSLDKKQVFAEQSKLINKINKEFGSYVFSNYVPSYKDLATIASMFNDRTPIKKRMIMEQAVTASLCNSEENQNTTEKKDIDELVMREFVKGFNKEYSTLLPEQRHFLTHYITAAKDGGVDFKVFLNEELSRIRLAVSESLLLEDVKGDEDMVVATNKIIALLEEFRKREMSEDDLKKVMKLQKLVSEYKSDAD
jgi:hypothetical protein